MLIRLHQAESAKGKNVINGEERHEKRQDKEKKTDNKSTGLTGSNSGPTGLTSANKTSLTIYDKEGPRNKRSNQAKSRYEVIVET